MSEMKTLRLGQVWSPVGQNISFENGAFARLIRKKKKKTEIANRQSYAAVWSSYRAPLKIKLKILDAA